MLFIPSSPVRLFTGAIWDILLWIGGFAVIDANLAGWRDELQDESEEAEGLHHPQ